MLQLRRRQRNNPNIAQGRQMGEISNTLVPLEQEIKWIIEEIGSDFFSNLAGASNTQKRQLIKMKVSKAKLYEAKVGVCEIQKKWDQRGSGTRVQARFKKIMNSKTKLLRSKWVSYNKKAEDYNTLYVPEATMATPSLEEVKSMDLTDPFWNLGSLTHPEEPWAVDFNVQRGISAYLTQSRCQEELARISREARQALKWAIHKSSKLDEISKFLRRDDWSQTNLPESAVELSLKELCSRHNLSTSALGSVYANLAKKHCRGWMAWNSHFCQLLIWSQKYLSPEWPEETDVGQQWDLVMHFCKLIWEELAKVDSVIMELEDNGDYEEEEILQQEELQTPFGMDGMDGREENEMEL
ncbi:hypothetical protein PTTG_26239 [Puccinia triticina 1-1 BBBD Race 1]|uniref:Uncharacterized protein n=1 Tax=Puccinia triticina (isolate 1-1 / race 1 (BBBD)) TaxID=630390 RepID=A0A180GXM9_PUCT1|nr:hypothetical protein PTTG_26239 [Puccinia triticina 1-1 BBBD Race 1]